jgi:hypothetical protein
VFREPRVKDEKHRKFVAGLPCCVCRNNIETEAAHVRMSCLKSESDTSARGRNPQTDGASLSAGGITATNTRSESVSSGYELGSTPFSLR